MYNKYLTRRYITASRLTIGSIGLLLLLGIIAGLWPKAVLAEQSAQEQDVALQEAFFETAEISNVRHLTWRADVTPRIRMRLGMQTIIVLPNQERIYAVIPGNESVFHFDVVGEKFPDRIAIRSDQAEIDTSLTLQGESGKLYHFYLFVDPVDAVVVPDLVVYIQDPEAKPEAITYPLEEMEVGAKGAATGNTEGVALDQRAETLVQPSDEGKHGEEGKLYIPNDYLDYQVAGKAINSDYGLWGDSTISPQAVYDDGVRTYFDFRALPPYGRLPVLYRVMDGYDTVVNSQFLEGILVAEGMGEEGWTLRHGEKTVCIKPDKAKLEAASSRDEEPQQSNITSESTQGGQDE